MSDSIQKDELIRFLDSEITHLRGEINRSGWTIWATWGAIAALAWLFLSEIQLNKYSLQSVSAILFVIWLLFVFLVLSSDLINLHPLSNELSSRFRPGYHLSRNRAGLILYLVLQIYFIFVITALAPVIGIWGSILAYIFISYMLFVILAVLIMNIADLPLPAVAFTRTADKIGAVVVIVILAILLWSYSNYLFGSPFVTDVYDVRLALLIAALLYLIISLVTKSHGSITLDILMSIKRECIFSRIDVDQAMRQADIALSGLSAADYLEKYVSKLLQLVRDQIMEIKTCVANLEIIEKLYVGKQAASNDENKSQVISLIESLFQSGEKIKVLNDRYTVAFRSFETRVLFVRKLTKRSEDLDVLLSKLRDEQNDLQQQTKLYQNRLGAVRELAQKTVSVSVISTSSSSPT